MKPVLPSQSIHTAIPYLILGLILLIQGVAIYFLNAGKFLYILDDPYIHLSLARNIAHGHYGINVVEPSAPSSSILWPFILAIFARLPLFEYVPLLLNLILGFLALFFIQKTIKLIFQDQISQFKHLSIITGFIIIANLVPLIFSGMEHVLQVVITMIITYNLLELQINQKLNKLLIVALILNPFVRYETLALSVPVLLFLYLKGYRRLAGIGLVGTLLPLAGFSYFLHSLGLGYLPTSVIIKSSLFSNKSSIEVLMTTLLFSMEALTWFYLLGMLILIGLKVRNNISRQLSLITATAIGLQLIFGTTLGAFYRYETYMIVFSTLICLYLYRESVPAAFITPIKTTITILVILVMLTVSDYVYNLIYIPVMSNNIYSQQYQMARFTNTYYRGRVGVNDIGLVSYLNNDYTLDLFGLSNIDVIDYRKHQTPNWMEQIASSYNVDLIMIYAEWFPTFIPDQWTKLGDLHLSTQLSAAAHRDVAFYVRNPANAEAIGQLLEQFSQSLPKGSEFRFAQE
ncbi:hypothetical protein [Herpetosiphon geysericola]|uniref:Glycosyltransferase RgtA/B/C/D-like domain-containing protein n=1 Tax=Herpetosiphon geysericola TaxID=70996 RepID=A0A0P6YLJ3_9CHLR|nr:hypothetical protein [Herpetosiphon geysericola]KPL86127.1 hypothetical protein SE18_14785 [Herpetosiphon geysericola]